MDLKQQTKLERDERILLEGRYLRMRPFEARHSAATGSLVHLAVESG